MDGEAYFRVHCELPVERNGPQEYGVAHGEQKVCILSPRVRENRVKKKKKELTTISNCISFAFADKVIFIVPEDGFSFLINPVQRVFITQP